MARSVLWLLLFAILIACLYVYSYYRFATHVEVQQMELQNFTFDMLREKQPIVIDDRLVRLEDLQRLWFSSNKVATFRLESSDVWHNNKFKYLVMHAEQEGDIYLYPAGKNLIEGGVPDPAETLLAIHLLPGQVMIVPFKWHYLIMQPMRVSCLGVHDYVTYLLP